MSSRPRHPEEQSWGFVAPASVVSWQLLCPSPTPGQTFCEWIGMTPGVLMYVYLGSLAGDLASIGTSGRARTPAEWTLYSVGLLATVAVTVYVSRLARAALRVRVGG